VVKRNTFTGIDKGHQWIEIPAVDGFQFGDLPKQNVYGVEVYGLGFYPEDSEYGGVGAWYSVGGTGGLKVGGCRCYSTNDRETGTRSDTTFEVEPITPFAAVVTCKQIRACLLGWVSVSRYSIFSNQCRTESEAALSACGLGIKR
jgi:hypothetical protein